MMRSWLIQFLVYGLYPTWMLAGFFDYLLHRRSHIETTSGLTESWLHIAQFAALAIFLAVILMFKCTPLILTIAAVLVLAHTVLAFIDVSYTDGLRYISPFEQLVHGVMNVVPIVALCLLAIINIPIVQIGQWNFQRNNVETPYVLWLLGSYLLLGGLPLLEEWLRTRHVVFSAGN